VPRHGRRDLTHAEIRDHLRELGASVVDLGDVGHDIPDLLVGFCDRDFLVEAKSAKGKLSDGQSTFAKEWRGQPPIVLKTKEAAREWYLRKRHELCRASEPKMIASGFDSYPREILP
jgi:hypothetical protein